MNFADMGIVAVPVITVIAFLFAELVKLIGLDSKWCPVICGFVGGVLGIVAMNVMTDYPATDILTAIAVGIVSGLGAVGCHQIYKQLTKNSGGDHLAADPDPGIPDPGSYEEIAEEVKKY